MSGELGEIASLIVRLTVFPTGVDDALPFEGEGADGAPVAFSRGSLGGEERFRPRAEEEALGGKFEEGLVKEKTPSDAAAGA